MFKIAVLLTCFNRRDTTLRCLRGLFVMGNSIDVYLVDDKSTDGTAAAVSTEFPQVHLISGTGHLYWSRGMYLAWEKAKAGEYSHFLWLNDDVALHFGCLDELIECSRLCGHQSIISGIIESHDGKEILYGGTNSKRRLLLPTGAMQNITNMNGNVVLVPAEVFAKLGNIDFHFHHDLGDVDYGLRAQQCSIKVFTTRIVVGSCDRNNTCRVRLWGSSLSNRFTKLYSPLGNHPKINFY
ncbi:MAG: glycosyltransferase family 2 protein, partial [Cytophaga sp.]|nr:glycosyltransferase family 2 protein [Undibacterium sp.]